MESISTGAEAERSSRFRQEGDTMNSSEKMGTRFSSQGHQIRVVAEAEALEKQAKTAETTLREPAGRTFTLRCDEGAYLGGEDTAPPPLSFLTSSIAF